MFVDVREPGTFHLLVLVVDAATEDLLDKCTVTAFDERGGSHPIYLDPDEGQYHYIGPTGFLSITVSCAGYVTLRKDVTFTSNQYLTVELTKE